MAITSEQVRPEVPLLPGGQRVLGHALEFRRDPLRLLQRGREVGDVIRIGSGRSRSTC